MCIAIGKPMGVDLPSESILRNCWYNNDDGAGFAYAIDGNVFIKKGYMTFEDFMKALNTANERFNLKERGVLMHFRIATHGARDASMTHPFPLNSDEGALKKIEYISDYAIIHNGIISLTSTDASRSKGLSDTALFIQKYLTKIATNRGWFRNKANMELIEDLIDSKMAILSRTGEINFTKGFTEDNGVFYSNSTYKDNYVRSYKYKGTTSYSGGYSNSHYGNYDYGSYSTGYNSYYGSKNFKYQSAERFAMMRAELGESVECDSGNWPITPSEVKMFYATKPVNGVSLIFQRFPCSESYRMAGTDEIFSDYEYVGTGNIYDKDVKIKTFKSDVSLYEDNFVGGITPNSLVNASEVINFSESNKKKEESGKENTDDNLHADKVTTTLVPVTVNATDGQPV